MRFDDREVLMVEVYNDVAVRRCPLALSKSLAMLSDVKGAGSSAASVAGHRRTWRLSPTHWSASRG